jgi:spore germination protein GerM
MKDPFIRNIVIGVLAFGVIAAVVYRFAGRGGVPGMGPGIQGSAVSSRSLVETAVQFYFADGNSGLLLTEERTFPHPETPAEFARMIVSGLLGGPEKDGVRTLPSEGALRALYVMKDGTAIVDFTKEIKDKHPGGVRCEYAAVMSVVLSLTANIPDIKRVTILIDGKEAETLAGHIDLGEPFVPDTAMVR